MPEWEYGVLFVPPHVSAYETVWLPSVETAVYVRGRTGVLIRRWCEAYEVIA